MKENKKLENKNKDLIYSGSQFETKEGKKLIVGRILNQKQGLVEVIVESKDGSKNILPYEEKELIKELNNGNIKKIENSNTHKPGDVVEMSGDNLENITKVKNDNNKEWWEDELLNNEKQKDKKVSKEDEEQIKYNEEQQKIMDAKTAEIEDIYSKMVKDEVEGDKNSSSQETISDEEYKKYIDNNEVSDSLIQNIVEKYKKGETLSPREQAIFSNNINKVEDEISKKKTVVIKAKKDIENTFDEEQKKKDDIEINAKLKIIGLGEDYFKDNESWQDFSKAEKLLILEQASQDTLSHVKEIGEQRFQEENKISWKSFKPLQFAKKIRNNIGKAYWISKAEKDVLKEVENGTMKPNEKVLDSLIERQNDLGLEVKEINGKTYIEFEPTNKNLSKEQKIIIDRYNRVANNFSQTPDSWKNEKSARSTDKGFKKENHLKFEELKKEYEKEKTLLIESKVRQYEVDGMSKSEAKEKVMLETKDADFKIAILQFTNTNPNALEELNKIKTESSWGRLLNNENMWRAGYMATGYGARTAFHSTIGFLTAPITAGIIGGIRARRKANENINKSFNEGRKEETFSERKEAGKKGLFDNKNKDQGALSYVFQGEKVNTKEVAAFIDADSQKQRIDNLVNKINNAKDDREKSSLMQQLEARLHYIELKQEQGLVNYGKENSIAKNYELFKTMSEAYVVTTTIDNLGIPLTREMNEDLRERDALLASIMTRNEKAFGEKIASHKNAEMLRGAMVGASFAVLGGIIRDWMHGDSVEHMATITPVSVVKPIEKIIQHAQVEAVADHGQGAISTLRELQHNLKMEYPDLSKAPLSVRHILNTDAHKLAQEYGMYKPGSDAESAFLKSGEKFTVDENGNVKFGNNLLEKGSDIKVDHAYEGKMFDSDHSGEVHESFKVPEQVDPVTDKPLHEIVGDEQVNPENGQPMHSLTENQGQVNHEDVGNFKTPEQVDPVTGKPSHIIDGTDKTNTETIMVEPSYTKEVIWNYSENLNHIFPTEKAMGTWHYINNNVTADRFIEMSKNGEITDAYKPLVGYINKLKDISGIRPEGETLINKAESISSYIARATKKVAELGQLDKVKL